MASPSSKRIQLVYESESIMKLNPLILYIMEIYLIEKELYYDSYSDMIDFIRQGDLLEIEVFLWLLELYGLA